MLRATAMNASRRKDWHFLAASKYTSDCIWCGERLRIGEPCRWHSEAKAVHEACFHEAFDGDEASRGTMVCSGVNGCGKTVVPRVSWQTQSNGKRCLRAECPCGAWIKNAPHVEPWIGMAKESA